MKTEPRPRVTCAENLVKLGRVVFEIYASGRTDTDRHADRNT